MAGTLIIEFSCTTNCNLGCTYCYSKHIPKYMTKEKADLFFKSVPKLMEIYDKDDYHISFFGGEPLLNWDIITYMLPKLNEDPKFKNAVVITNGLLLDEEKWDYLSRHRCGISMSFDGIWNNENRPLANGSKSFNKYIEKKDFYSNFIKGCKTMIQPGNFKTMTENFVFFVEEFKFYHPDFSLVRDDIYTDDDLKIFDYEVKRLADKVIEYNKKGIYCNVGLFNLYTLDLIAGKKWGKRPFGCFAGCGGALYASDGIYYPCERFNSEKEEFRFPVFDANTMTIFKENYEFLIQPKVSNPQVYPECNNCNLYNYCNAGCTHSQLKNGKWKRAKPVHSVCQLLRMSYRESMRIFNELKDNPNYIGGFKRFFDNPNN